MKGGSLMVGSGVAVVLGVMWMFDGTPKGPVTRTFEIALVAGGCVGLLAAWLRSR